jgi:hypothetical protein
MASLGVVWQQTPGEFAGFYPEGVSEIFDGSAARVYFGSAEADFVTNKTNIMANIFDQVLYHMMARAPSAIKYDSTPLAELSEYACHWIDILSILRVNNFLTQVMPNFTRDDVTAGRPFSRATLGGLYTYIDSQGQLPIPAFILPIVDFLSTPIQLAPPSEMNNDWAVYFYPQTKICTMASLESKLNAAQALGKGLLSVNMLNVKCVPFTAQLCLPNAPVSPWSDLAHAYFHYFPVKNYLTLSAQTLGASFVMNWNHALTIPEWYPLIQLFRTSSGTTKFVSVQDASSGKLSINYGAFDDTGLTEFPASGNTDLDCFFNVADARSLSAWVNMHAAFEYTHTLSFAGETEWSERLVSFLARHNGAGIAVKTLQIVPDLPVGAGVGFDTINQPPIYMSRQKAKYRAAYGNDPRNMPASARKKNLRRRRRYARRKAKGKN